MTTLLVICSLLAFWAGGYFKNTTKFMNEKKFRRIMKKEKILTCKLLYQELVLKNHTMSDFLFEKAKALKPEGSDIVVTHEIADYHHYIVLQFQKYKTQYTLGSEHSYPVPRTISVRLDMAYNMLLDNVGKYLTVGYSPLEKKLYFEKFKDVLSLSESTNEQVSN